LQSKCNQIINLYSATKQQAQRVLKRIQSRGELNPKKQYPLVLRRDLIDIRKESKFPCVYWMRIPVYPKSINVRIQTSCDYDLTAKEYLLRESKIVNKNKDWYVFITIEKETTALLQEQQPTNVLAIDLGCKNIAVTVNTANTRSEEHTSELQSQSNLVCRLLLEKKKLIRLGRILPRQWHWLAPLILSHLQPLLIVFLCTHLPLTQSYTLSLHDALPI